MKKDEPTIAAKEELMEAMMKKKSDPLQLLLKQAFGERNPVKRNGSLALLAALISESLLQKGFGREAIEAAEIAGRFRLRARLAARAARRRRILAFLIALLALAIFLLPLFAEVKPWPLR